MAGGIPPIVAVVEAKTLVVDKHRNRDGVFVVMLVVFYLRLVEDFNSVSVNVVAAVKSGDFNAA